MRPFLLTVVTSSVITLVCATMANCSEPRPNILFMMADDLGWADVAFHGGSAPTPNLDKLAAQGLELAQHYVAPVCSPTRTGLMTGRCWSRFNVTNPQNERALPWDTMTLPRALKSVGYDTCLTGKWHLGSLPEQGPNHFGFDHSYGSLAGGVSPYSHGYKKGPFTRTWQRNETLIEESGHVTDLIALEAIRWMESRGSAPFFLYVPMTAVHLPVKEPEEWLARVPSHLQGELVRHYAASIMHLDDAVGRILAALERTGKRDNTLVVFTSDNGGSSGSNNDRTYPDDHCPEGVLPGNNKPWRGKKGDLYEGGTRVATLVSWPGHVRPGKVDSPVQIIDWMPTLTSLAGYRPDRDLRWDGIDIGSLLITHSPLPIRTMYAVSPGWRSRSVRRANWKLIATEKPESRTELFNLDVDPHEENNLAERNPDRVKVMLELMKQVAAGDRESAVTE